MGEAAYTAADVAAARADERRQERLRIAEWLERMTIPQKPADIAATLRALNQESRHG